VLKLLEHCEQEIERIIEEQVEFVDWNNGLSKMQ
jgi:hypothetical protein